MHAIVVSSEKGKGTRDYFGSPFFMPWCRLRCSMRRSRSAAITRRRSIMTCRSCRGTDPGAASALPPGDGWISLIGW